MRVMREIENGELRDLAARLPAERRLLCPRKHSSNIVLFGERRRPSHPANPVTSTTDETHGAICHGLERSHVSADGHREPKA
jgi:hypothetical protein